MLFNEENIILPVKPFLKSTANNKPLILDSQCNEWNMMLEFKILNGYVEPLTISIGDVNVDNCPYVLPELSSVVFLNQEKIILANSRLEEFCSILQQVRFRAGLSEYYLNTNKLGQRHETTLLIPMISHLFDWLANDTLYILERSARYIKIGASIALSETDFELSKGSRVRIVVEIKDAKDPKCKNIVAQLVGSFLAIAQSQLHNKEEEEYIIYGITIIDYTFQFYQTCISKQYLKDICDGNEPTEKLQIKPWIIGDQRKFSLIQSEDRKKILQLIKLMATN